MFTRDIVDIPRPGLLTAARSISVLPRIRTKRFSALTSSFFSTLVELTINLGDLVDEHPAEADVNGVTYVLEGTSITLLALMQLINVSEVLQRRNTSKHNEVEAQSGVNQDVHRLFSAAIVHLSTLLPETAVLSDSAEHERMAAGAAMYQEANAKPCDVWPAIIVSEAVEINCLCEESTHRDAYFCFDPGCRGPALCS